MVGSPRHGEARHGKGRVDRAVLRPRILGRQDLLTRDDLEAMREEFGAGEQDVMVDSPLAWTTIYIRCGLQSRPD